MCCKLVNQELHSCESEVAKLLFWSCKVVNLELQSSYSGVAKLLVTNQSRSCKVLQRPYECWETYMKRVKNFGKILGLAMNVVKLKGFLQQKVIICKFFKNDFPFTTHSNKHLSVNILLLPQFCSIKCCLF